MKGHGSNWQCPTGHHRRYAKTLIFDTCKIFNLPGAKPYASMVVSHSFTRFPTRSALIPKLVQKLRTSEALRIIPKALGIQFNSLYGGYRSKRNQLVKFLFFFLFARFAFNVANYPLIQPDPSSKIYRLVDLRYKSTFMSAQCDLNPGLSQRKMEGLEPSTGG